MSVCTYSHYSSETAKPILTISPPGSRYQRQVQGGGQAVSRGRARAGKGTRDDGGREKGSYAPRLQVSWCGGFW